ncbi:MAG: hypothetical protein ABI120_10825 [Gemmatimonadaceae bacterium]
MRVVQDAQQFNSSALVADAPTRLDFGGGWTDVPPYPEELGGFVCNLAIERRATVRLSLGEAQSAAPHQPLVAAACREAGVANVRVELTSDFPVGAGLGGSSAAGVALAAALSRWCGRAPSAAELAELSRKVEVTGLQMAGGFQDHYAAAFGGALALSFGAETRVRQLAISSQTVRTLEAQLLLLYTGESRISGATITAVLDAYKAKSAPVVLALQRMKELAIDMATALEDGDVNTLGALVGEHWTHQRSLHPNITTERIDAIAQHAYAAGATGLKALGASGGGCVIVFAPDHSAERIEKAVSPFAARLPWSVAHCGVRLHDLPDELPLPFASVPG